MTNTYVAGGTPKNVQWWGIAAERASSSPFLGAPGTVTAPVISIPLDSAMPSDQPNMLLDKGIRGDMGEDYNIVLGTELGQFPLAGDVYLDSIGHLLYNLFGEYQATGTVTANTATASGAITQGLVTAITVATFTSAPTAGQYVQIVSSAGASEVCVVGTGSTTGSLVLASPGCRFNHAAGAVCTVVNAPFTHTFKLLNPGGTAYGLPANAQPITHTITHYNGLSGTYLARQYAYWAASGMDFTMDTNNLFQHNSRGTSILGADATAAVTNSQTGEPAQPNWLFKVSLGGPLSNNTYVLSNVESAACSPTRTLPPKFALTGQQAPVLIARLGLTCAGKLTFIGINETPLNTMLAGTQQQLQIGMTNGLSGAAALGITFNWQLAQFEAAQLADPDLMMYDVGFRGLMNSTGTGLIGTTGDAGISGGRAPMSVQLVNAIPTY